MSNPFPELQAFDPANGPRQVQPRTIEQADSFLAQEMRRERDTQIRQTIESSPNPDQVARGTRVAREAGVPPLMVDGRLDEAERGLNAQKLTGMMERYPAIGQWAVNNPRAAATAQDDHEALGLLGGAWDWIKRIGRGAGGNLAAGSYRSVSGLREITDPIANAGALVTYGVEAGIATIGNATGMFNYDPDRVDKAMGTPADRRAAERARMMAESARITKGAQTGNWTVDQVLQGLQSVPVTLAAAATRNPSLMLAIPATTVAGNEYREARDKGLDAATAIRYGVTQGTIEAITEKIPADRLASAIANKTPFGRAFIQQIAAEMPGEQVATLLQDFTQWVYLNPGKTLSEFVKERPEAALSTALGTIGGVGAQTGTISVIQRAADVAGKVVNRAERAGQAKQEWSFFVGIEKAAEQSKLRTRDPEAYNDAVRHQAEDAGVSHVFIPADAVLAYMQSDSYDSFSDPLRDYADDISEAAATGGDFVLPAEIALGTLPGTSAWAALRDDMRLSPGGMSTREADTFNAAMDDVIAELSDQVDRQDKAARENQTAIEKLTSSVQQKLQDAGYIPSVSRQQAELIAQRAVTRAQRMGQEITGNEFDTEVRQVAPPALAAARKADATDLVINALRKGKPSTQQDGATLLRWIANRGGLNDVGGDLKSMGLDKWHRGKPGQKKAVRDFDPRQASMGGLSGEGDFGIDTTLRAAIEAGFFPELANVENEGGASTLDTQALLDAIGEELAGVARYASEAKVDPMRAAAEELQQLLSERGLDPSQMTDAELRDEIAKLDEQGPDGGFEQSFSNGPRGRIVFPQGGFGTGPTIIELFKGRNLSTLTHELGHQWLEELRFDATNPDAPDSLKADWQTVQDWFKANGHPLTDGVIPVEAHELWARGIERYLMEGKAPSTGLKRLFETFRGWMISIYKTIDRLKAPISPEIREVMDRLIATDDEIAQARDEQALAPLFKDAAAIGMTGPEFDAYTQQVQAARGEAQGKLLDKTMAAIRHRETAEWRDNRAKLEAEAAESVDARPLYRALRAMKETPISREWIVDRMGQDALSLLPKRVPPIYREGGVHPDSIAEMAGYPSGRDMVDDLIGAEEAHRQAREGGDQRTMRERTIGTEVDAEMNRRYGDPLNDGSIEREALAAVHNEMQGEVIASEIRVLARKTGKRPTPYAIAREWARQRVRQGVYAVEASPSAIQRHARSAAKAGRQAEAAMLKGDLEETMRFKQQQMLSSALLAEAKAANDEIGVAVARMGKIAKRQTMKSVDQEYLEQAHALLEAVDLRERTQKSIQRQGKWEAWAAAREAEGYDIVVPASFEATLGKTNWTQLSPETLLGLDAAVKQVIHLGRLKQTLLDNQEQREWDEVVGEAIDGAGGLDQKPPRDLMEPGWADRFGSRIASVDAGLLKMETVFDWLDGGNPNGVFNRVAFRPIADAQSRANDMTVDYFGRIRGLFEALPAATLKQWSEVAVLPFTNRETGLPERMSRKQLIAVALNTGNAGNLQRLTDGYGWNAAALQDYLASELTADEWRFVQDVWDTIDTLWPEIEAMEKRVNGIAPEKVEPSEIVTPHGTFRGGYYPAVYDSSRDLAAEENRGREADLFATQYTRASTQSSATKARAEKVSRPILLDLGVINRHIGEVIHDITHREAVMQAHRFLTDRRVAAAVDRALGPEIRQAMRPWVKFVANSWAMERAGNEGIGKFFGKLRANATAVGMGFRISTAMTQIAGYSNSFEVVGEKWVVEAIARVSASPIASFDFVMERSGEVRHRMDTLDRDIRTAISQSPLGKLGEVKRFMFHGIGYMDRVVVIPTWIGAYNKALSAGMGETDAIYAADKAIRQSQGSGSPKDLAAIARGTGQYGKMLQIFTMFYSYFSAAYQRQRTLGRDAMGRDRRRSRNLPKLMARAWWMLVVPAVLPDMIKMALGGHGGPDDDEWWVGWTFKKLLSNALGPIPLARDIIEPAWDKAAGNKSFGYSLSPLQRAGETFVNVAGDAGKIARGDETKRATRNVLESVGYATGLVPGQIASAVQFLVDVGEGDADPQGFADWWEGLTTGKLKD